VHGVAKLQECKTLVDLATLEKITHMHLKAGADIVTAAQVKLSFCDWGKYCYC
jgi:hypothetical protein